MLRIWWCDCALCVIGNEFPCRQPHKPSAKCEAFHVAPRIKTARRFTAKTPDDNMISWKKAESNLQKQFGMVGTRSFASATND